MADAETSSVVPSRRQPVAILLPIFEDHRTDDAGFSLIEALLHEQQTLSAVEQFSRAQQDGLPGNAAAYERLLPAKPPRDGQQYAFEVDLDQCSG